MPIVDLCEAILRKSFFHATPLQRKEFRKLIDADASGDKEESDSLTGRIEEHFIELNKTFESAAEKHVFRYEIAYTLVQLVYNEYAAAEDRRNYHNTFALAYGNTEQQMKALSLMKANDDLGWLAEWREKMERYTLDELCLDRDYTIGRLEAFCKETNLVRELLRAYNWDGLTTLLDRDEEVCNTLVPWLTQLSYPVNPFLEEAREVIATQINHYRAVADDRLVSADPPPPYSAADPNAPSVHPGSSSGLMNLVGLNQVLDRVRHSLNWSGGD